MTWPGWKGETVQLPHMPYDVAPQICFTGPPDADLLWTLCATGRHGSVTASSPVVSRDQLRTQAVCSRRQ